MKRPAKLGQFFILILLGLGLGSGYYFLHRPKVSPDQLRMLATWGLADHLAKHHPGGVALVLSNPFVLKEGINPAVVDQEKSGIDGLRQGFGGRLTLAKVVYPELKPEAKINPQSLIANPSVTTPLSFMLATNALDLVAGGHPECDLWISLIGLPTGLKNVQVWTRSPPPKFALLLPDLRMIGNAEAVREAVHSGKLTAFVLTKPNVTFNTETMEGELADEFARRYVLIHAGNVDEMIQKYPALFQAR